MEDLNAAIKINNFILSTIATNNLTTGSTEMSNSTHESIETYKESMNNENVSTSTWNASKFAEQTINKGTTSNICTTTTIDPFDEFGPPEGVEYIFVPLGVMIFVVILSAVVLIISRKRKLERLRHRLMPLYNFDPGEEGEDDWETELLDEGFNSHQRRQGYQSMNNQNTTELLHRI